MQVAVHWQDADSSSAKAFSEVFPDREVVLSPAGWLTDKIICAVQRILLQFFPNMAGLQPPVLQKVFQFHVHSGEVCSDCTCQKQPLVRGVHSWL